MRERGIIFQGWGVREIIEDRKTQTRRVMRIPEVVRPEDGDSDFVTVVGPDPNGEFHARMTEYPEDGSVVLRCPYGKPGDLLWVRETWRFVGVDMNRHGRTHHVEDCVVEYRDETQRTIEVDWQIGEAELLRHNRWRPSIHMPRWASRLTLRITDVRVQRVQEITEGDARYEGLYSEWDGTRSWFGTGPDDKALTPHARLVFPEVWDSINGKRAPWSNNPWVWAISFEVAG